jgi:glycerol-3-phosphate O-acyltransferase/dihydroxyacetone phosphate acyltransferase
MRIMRSLNRRVSWLMAAKSFERPFIGTMARLIGAVPVTRAMDQMKAAEGTVYLPDPAENPRLLRGIGTKFDGPGLEVGWSIYLPVANGESHKLDIAEIHGPEEIILKKAPTSDPLIQLTGRVVTEEGHLAQDAKGGISRFMGSKFKVAPNIDQTQVYNAVFDRLRTDDCVGIFPEGGSHDRPEMLPLKGKNILLLTSDELLIEYLAGIAIMALGALAQDSDVAVVPVGMNYFHAHKFRSRAVVEFGDPIEISSQLVNDFKNGNRWETVGALLGDIYQSLSAVTVASPDFETLMVWGRNTSLMIRLTINSVFMLQDAYTPRSTQSYLFPRF